MAQVPELQRFRAKYPEYGDMDDAALADRLAAKYPEAYSDLPGKVRSETPEPPRQTKTAGMRSHKTIQEQTPYERVAVAGTTEQKLKARAEEAWNAIAPPAVIGRSYSRDLEVRAGRKRWLGENVIQPLEEMVGTDASSNWALESAARDREQARAISAATEAEYPVTERTAQGYLKIAADSIDAQLPAMVAGGVVAGGSMAAGAGVRAATRAGAAISLLPMGEGTGAAAYEKYRGRGIDPTSATVGAGAEALFEVGTELLPMGKLFGMLEPGAKRSVREFAHKMGQYYGEEAIGESVAALTQNVTDKILSRPGMTAHDKISAVNEYFASGDAFRDWVDTMAVTAIQSTATAGAVGGARRLVGGGKPSLSYAGPDTDLLNQLPDDPEYTARQERVQSRLATAIQPAQQAQASDNVGSFLDPMMRRAMENRRGASFAPDPLVTNTVNAIPVGAPYERVEAEVLPPAAEPSFTPTALIPQFARDVESEDMGTYDLSPPSVIAESEEADMTAIDRAAHEAATSPLNSLPEPTEGQKKAGNYKKGHTSIYGLGISIENPVGSVREGVDKDGTPWRTELKDSYGYFKRTTGKDKDHIDVFIPAGFTPDVLDDQVFVIDQIDPETGRFDEHKIVFGARTADEARTIYLRNYDASGFRRIGAVTGTTVPDFKKWLGSKRKTTQPFGEIQRGQEFSQTARPAGMGRAKTAPVTDTSTEAVPPVRGVDGQSGDGMPVVQSGDVAAEQAIPGTDSGNTAAGVVEGGDAGGQEEGRRQEVLNNEGATPLPETVSAPRPPALLPEQYRISRQTARNAAKILPPVGKTFSPDDRARVKMWAKAEGLTAMDDGAGVRVIDNNAQGYVIDRIPQPTTAKNQKAAAEALRRAEVDNARKEKRREQYAGASSRQWIDDTFGPDFANEFNKAALARYLDGTDAKFSGLINNKWLEGLAKLGITTEADDIAGKVKEEYQRAQEPPIPSTRPADVNKEPKERAAEQAQTTLQSILSSERGSIELPNREEAAAMVKGMTDSLNRLFGSATGVYGATKLMAADAAETLFGKPIFTAERRPTLKPVVENAINRQQDFHETLANFYEWNEDEGTVTTLIDLRKEHKKLPRADKKAVAKLVFEGDILKGEFETVESARAALGGDVAVSRTAFDFYRRFRAYINTLYRKVRQEQVANALVPYESSPELHDTLRAMLEYDGELNADMVEPAVWDAFMDVKGMQLIAPEYQNKPWFDDLVNLLGYKFRERSQKHAWNKQAPWKEVKGTPEKWADKISTDTLESPARMKELVAALKHIQENKLVEKRVRRAKEQVMEARKGLKAMRDDFGALPGWFPRLRNDGRFYVAVTMPAAEAGAKPVLVYYELVGSPEAAKALEKKIAADPSRYVPKEYQGEGAEFTTSTGESSKLDESIYAAAAGDLAIQAVIDRGLSRMKDKEGLNDSEYDELQSSLYRSTLDVILARGAGRHQIKRADHLIGGYRTDDPFQILDDYIRGTVGSITKARYSMRQAIALRELSGSDQAWAFGYVRDTLMNTSQAQRVAATMAGIATFNYLGFRFTSALLNATQNWTYGYPELSIHSRRAASVMAKAQKDILTGRKLGAEEQAALEQGIRKGMSMETITSEMAGHGEGMQNRFGQGVTALNNVSMWLFQVVERYVNREAGFLAAYRVFRTPDFAPTRQDPYDSVAVEKALDFVAKVHGVPGKANMPAWARTNPVGRGVFTLSSFTMDRFNWLFNRLTSGEKQQVMAAARAVGVMVLLGGVGSLPFLDEINRLLRKLFGVDFKLEARKWVEEKARDYGAPEDAIADYIFHGAPAGAGINVSNAMRVQVPIASALLQGEGALEAVSGPLGGVVLKIAKAGEMAAKGEGDKALESLAPEAVATALRAKRLSEEGMTTSGGKLILDRDPKTGEIGPVKLDPSERAVKSLGFNPLEASKRMEKADTRIALKQFWTERKDRALARVNALLLTGKQEDRQTANNLVLKFNARLAESQARELVPPITRVKPYKLDKRAIQWDSAQEEE